jgi:hypothetical protein
MASEDDSYRKPNAGMWVMFCNRNSIEIPIMADMIN